MRKWTTRRNVVYRKIERKHSIGGFVLDDAAGGVSRSHHVGSNDFNLINEKLKPALAAFVFVRFRIKASCSCSYFIRMIWMQK